MALHVRTAQHRMRVFSVAWGRAALVIATLGIGLVAAVWAAGEQSTRTWLFGLGFLTLAVAALVALVARIRARGLTLTALPVVAFGWVALLLAVLVAVLLIAIPARSHVNLYQMTLLLTLTAFLTAVSAIRKGERALPVLVLAVLPATVALAFFVGELALPL